MRTIGRALAVTVAFLLGVVVGLVSWGWRTFGHGMPFAQGADLGPQVFMIDDGYVAAFAITGAAGEVALIDCGNDPDGKALLLGLKKKGINPEDVRTIFLTHGHPDHTAACRLFPRADTLAMPEEVPLAEAKEPPRALIPRLLGVQPQKAAKITRTLKDGEEVYVGDTTVTAYAVPGHTAGSAAFVARDVLFLGDNAMTTADGKLEGAPPGFTDDRQQNLASLKKLAERLTQNETAITALAVGHNGPLAGRAALDALVGK
jgi:hydroxyacylglutathione hydrolase